MILKRFLKTFSFLKHITNCLLFKSSQSEDGIRPEEELGDLIQQSLLPGPNLEVTTGT